MKPKIDYNQKTNILSIKLSQKKSVDSDIKNNIVMDYAKDGWCVTSPKKAIK